jgi:hypothetical protein
MSTNRFVTIKNGIRTLVTAIAQSTGATDANKVISTNSAGKLDASFLPSGVGLQTEAIVTSEAIAAGDFVNVFNNTGTRTVRKADASNNRPAHGYVLEATTSGQNATVYKTGGNSALSGLTPGQLRYLSPTTAGTSTATAPSAAGHIIQCLGFAESATSIQFEFDEPVAIE